MESFQKSKLVEFNPTVLYEVRKMYGLEGPGKMDRAVEILDDWIQKQDHFVKKDFCRAYLENAIIASKGSIEKAKRRLDKYCSIKAALPKYFGKYQKSDFVGALSRFYVIVLPKYGPEYTKVTILKTRDKPYQFGDIVDFFRLCCMCQEYLKLREYVNGYITIVDYSERNILELISKTNPLDLAQGLTALIEGFGMRLLGIHIVTPSKSVDILISLLKRCVSAKIGQRIHAHTTIDTLFNYVPKDIFPLDYGGKEQSLKELQETWVDELLGDENTRLLEEMMNARTNEALRRKEDFDEVLTKN